MADPVIVTDPGHPLLADFVALGDPATRRKVEREGGYFVVEGVLAIERLLDVGGWAIRSFAFLPRVAERLASRIEAAAPDVAVAVAEEDVLRAVVGFDLHRGALASVERRPPQAAADVVARTSADGRVGGLLLAAEGVNDHENLGALYRNAAAFGVSGVLLDPTSADPFYRRSVRVSLGHVLAVPTGILGATPGGIEELHDLGVTTLALTPAGELRLQDLTRAGRPSGPTALLVGAEGPGLTEDALRAASHRVRIPMAAGVDSLNVGTAAAIALHHLRSIEVPRVGRHPDGQSGP